MNYLFVENAFPHAIPFHRFMCTREGILYQLLCHVRAARVSADGYSVVWTSAMVRHVVLWMPAI